MKKSYFFLLMLCFVASCMPKDTTKWSMERINRYEKNIKCTLGTKYSLKQRRKMYPFDKAQKVLFIAFRNHEMYKSLYKTLGELMDTTINADGQLIILPKIEEYGCASSEIIKRWDHSDIDSSEKFRVMPSYCAIESVELSSNQVDTLSNFLINYELNKSPLTCYVKGCYMPRNAILFLNARNQIIALIEICYECLQMKFSYGFRDDQVCDCHCSERGYAVRSLFSSLGIKHGIEPKQ